MLNRISHTALIGAALGLAATPALALDADAFAGKLSAAVKLMGASIDYGTAQATGDTVTIADFTIAVPGEDAIEIPGEIVFEGVVETPEGGYTAERATIADIDYTDPDEGVTVTFANILAEGIALPAEIGPATALEVGMGLYDRLSAGPLSVSMPGGGEIFAVDSMEVTIDDPAADGGITSAYEISGVRGELAEIDDAEAREVIGALGLETITATLSGAGTWWPESGRAEIADLALDIDQLGAIRMSFAVEGYTREMYRELIKINLKMAELSEAGETLDDAQMAGLEAAMLEEFSAIELDTASIRYDDASLVMKALDFAAAEQGLDGTTFAQGLKFAVPMMLTELDNAQFTEMVTGAVNAFLDDPQNFEIAAEPSEPVGIEAFMGVEDDPLLLIDLLNVQVRANQ